MISFHKLDAKYSSLAIFKSVISIIKFSLSALLHVQAQGSERAFHPEPQSLHVWVTGRDKVGMTGDFESLTTSTDGPERSSHTSSQQYKNGSLAKVGSTYISETGSDPNP